MKDIGKIRKENIEDIMDLTDTQKGMLYHYIKDADTKEYQEQTCITITGEIDVEILKKSWKHIVKTNEMLRTVYKWDKLDKPVQIVLKDYDIPFKVFDLSKENEEIKDELFKGILENHRTENIDISNESIKITICKIKEDKYMMILKNHHILYDGWSNGIILREFIEAYNCYFQGKEPIKQIKNKFKQFIKYNKEQDKNRQKKYWQEYLRDFEYGSNVLNSKNVNKTNKYIGEHTYIISELTKGKLEVCGKKLQVSVAAILYSAWAILQQRYENSEDIILGITVSGRTAKIKGIDDIVGLFINTIPLRVRTDNNQEAYKLIKSVEESLRAHEEFENTSLSDIKSYGEFSHEKSLFDNIVVVENYPLDKSADKNSKIKIEECFISESTNFNLTFAISIFDDLEIKVSYNKESFQDEFIITMTKHYENILNEILKNETINISEIEMISEEEKHKFLYDFNDTYADYPRNKTIHELFEEQVEKTPDNIAIVFEDKKLTYRELNEKANRLARTLREKGVKPESIAGIMVNRSLEMIVGTMAILKAGGAYLPIDPDYPEDRVKYMLEDSKTNILLTENILADKAAFNGEIIILENEKNYSADIENLQNINTDKDLAYVIYTSGSTGKPKGVMVEHGSIAMTLQWRRDEYKLNSKDTVLQLFSYAFDGFVTSFFTPVISGSKVVILSNDDAKDMFSIKEKLLLHKVTHFIAVPSMCLAIMEQITSEEAKNLRIITLAGESVTSRVIKKCKSINKNIELVNEYGPTENSVVTTIMRNMEVEKTISIGKPKDNTQIYILSNQALNPIGIAGEICISGEGLARGYLNNEKLTSERFIENPFIHGKRMYRTGDLGRWLPNGNIEFIGRIDHQVKIRGFRIELGEIEKQLLKYVDIKETIVIDREDKNEVKYLCAYFVSDKQLTVGELREHLSKELPEYMVPSYFIQLKEIPVTSNGKIDRKALPEPDGNIVTGIEYEKARNEAEEKLVEIWSEVLGVENIGINHNFFDMGGHSLKAISLVSKIRKELNVEVSIMEIFKSPTIKGISEYIQSTEKNIYEEIRVIEEKEYYEASSAQKRMYMLQHFDLKSTSYNMPGVLEVEGNLDVQRLELVFNKLIKRHETLRTSFENIEGKIVQKVSRDIDFKVAYIDIRKTMQEGSSDKEILILDNNYDEKHVNEEIEKLMNSFVSVFDLNKAPLLRVGVIRVKEEKHIIMFDMHHIISDGVSMGILINEFSQLYDGKDLEKMKIQYKDFSAWQNNVLKSEKMKDQEKYWLERFNEEIPVLNIPTDFIRPSVQSFEGDSISFKLDKELTSNLNKIAKEIGSTMYMVLLSGVNILLSKYSGQEDIVIGSPIAGRPHADLEKIIGMFVNTLAMRNNPNGSKTYEKFLTEVKENALRAYENQDYQFEELVDKLNIRRDISRNPLFDVMFTMQNMDLGEIDLEDLRFIPYEKNNKVAKFDLTFTAIEIDEEILVDITYCTKLFKQETIERMREHFKNIFKAVIKNTSVKLSEIEMLSEDEKNKVLYEFNDTYAQYPRNKTIHQLFEEQVEKTPDNIAVIFEDKKLTYAELNHRANRLARTLREKGVKQDSIVGIMVERSFEMIVGIMGILKAGGAYLPIDLNYPKERIEYMLKDSESKLLLSKNTLAENIHFNGEVIDLFNEELFKNKSNNLEQINTSSNLAYVIYTSGTTGNPKGVMIEHRSLNNYVQYAKINYCIEENIHMPLYTSISFDLTVTSIFTPLISGSSIIIYEDLEIDKLTKKVFCGERQSVIKLTPAHLSLLKEMKDINRSINRFIVGGEDLTKKVAESVSELFDNKVDIINEYGPTEATIGCIVHKYNHKNNYKNSVLIGKPINNTQIYILDFKNRPLPVGVVGEIYISGDGLARGYLNKPELTAEKFVDNPFETGKKMYKTGDLALWLPDGNIELLGRIDNQVKIRGFRIELGEIENRILQHENIKETVVLVKENKENEKYICAYFVSDKKIQKLDLKGYLKERLPEYMVPTYFVELEKMPLTANGKLDRRALPEPNLDATLSEYEAPRNEVEETLVKIWSEVLGVQNIGINNNFFELGGHSLKATILLSKIHKELNKEILLKELFKAPTIKDLSRLINDLQENPYSMIKTLEEADFYETSSAQKRMFIINQFDKNSVAYNMPVVLQLEGQIDKIKIEEALNKLIRRHDSLRTYFETDSNEIIQKIIKEYNFKLLVRNEDENLDKIIKNFIKPFDLGKAPLFRAEVFENNGLAYLIIDMHHIISDGVSMNILIKEFEALYNGGELEPLKLQYKDFAAWQNKFLESQEIKKQEEYWINNFKDEIPILNLKCDYERPNAKHFEGNTIRRQVEEHLAEKLRNLAKETGTTVHMVLLSAFNILLYKYSGQEDIIVGTPVAGRPHADIYNIMGIFVNTLALRNKPKGNKKYIDFLFEVKENSLKAYENQSYQLETLVEKLGVRRDASRNPLFDVMFSMLDLENGDQIRLGEILAKNYEIGNNAAKVDLTLRFMEKPKNILLALDFSISLYNVDTVEMMIDDYIYILQTISENRDARIDNIVFGSNSSRTITDLELGKLEEDFCI